jgi:hypothetical protein
MARVASEKILVYLHPSAAARVRALADTADRSYSSVAGEMIEIGLGTIELDRSEAGT